MKPLLLAAAVALLIGAAPPPPKMVRYRAVLMQRQSIDLSSLDEGTQITERSDTVYARLAALDSAGGHLVLLQLDSVAFHSADRDELPPEEVERLRGATSQFFLPPDGSAPQQTVLTDGGGLSAGIYAGLLDLLPRLRGPLTNGATWSDSTEIIQRGEEDYRHARYRTNYLIASGADVRAAFAGAHTRLNGPVEISGTSAGTVRWTLGADRLPQSGSRQETQTLLWKDDELPAPLPLVVTNETTLLRLP